MIRWATLGLLAAAPASAQVVSPLQVTVPSVDLSQVPTKAEVAAAKSAADAARALAATAVQPAALDAVAARNLEAMQAQIPSLAPYALKADVTTAVAALPTTNAVSSAIATATAPLATAAALAALSASVPKPATATPPTEMIGGTVGTAGTYRPADAAQPRITRAGVVTTDTSGNWSITWSSPLAAIPTVLPVPINSTTQPIVCNVATRTATAAAGRCWLARTLPATIVTLTALVTYDVFGAPASGVAVQVIALPPTQ